MKFPEFMEYTESSCRNQLRNCTFNVNYHLNPRVAQSSQFRPPAIPPISYVASIKQQLACFLGTIYTYVYGLVSMLSNDCY